MNDPTPPPSTRGIKCPGCGRVTPLDEVVPEALPDFAAFHIQKTLVCRSCGKHSESFHVDQEVDWEKVWPMEIDALKSQLEAANHRADSNHNRAEELQQRLLDWGKAESEAAAKLKELQAENVELRSKLATAEHTYAVKDALVVRVATQERNLLVDLIRSLPNSPTWPYVLAFAKTMEEKLAMNRHKGDREGWVKDPVSALMRRLDDEMGELDHAVHIQSIAAGSESADVANFAMMVADVLGQLVLDEKTQALCAVRAKLELSPEDGK